MVNLPRQRSYVHTCPADKFFLRFDYIFDMFHLKKLDFTFVRLFALYMNYIIGIQQIPYIFVADLYFMHEGFLAVCAEYREYARDYIVDFMVSNRTRRRFSCLIIPCKSSTRIFFLRFQSFICTMEAN